MLEQFQDKSKSRHELMEQVNQIKMQLLNQFEQNSRQYNMGNWDEIESL
jgi:hypothetical protein